MVAWATSFTCRINEEVVEPRAAAPGWVGQLTIAADAGLGGPPPP